MTSPGITDEPPPGFRVRAIAVHGSSTLREVTAQSANGAIIAVQTFRDEYETARIIVNVSADADGRELEALRVAAQHLGCVVVIGG
jgi:hypothetical protein